MKGIALADGYRERYVSRGVARGEWLVVAALVEVRHEAVLGVDGSTVRDKLDPTRLPGSARAASTWTRWLMERTLPTTRVDRVPVCPTCDGDGIEQTPQRHDQVLLGQLQT